MNDEQRLKALGNYLRSCRSRLTPESVGLPPGHNRRRIPGLRREEVAQLANVSITWYTWLEQGRDIRVSREILDCIGRALRLSSDEYIHMMNLARFPVEAPAADPTIVTSGLRKIIDDLTYPAMAINYRADVIAWNAAACRVLVDFAAMPAEERNMLWLWFADETLQARIANWEERSPYAIALFRGYCDKYADDPWFPRMVETLKQVSPYFKEQWNRHEVRQKNGATLDFLIPGSDKQSFEVMMFPASSAQNVHLFVFTPS